MGQGTMYKRNQRNTLVFLIIEYVFLDETYDMLDGVSDFMIIVYFCFPVSQE